MTTEDALSARKLRFKYVTNDFILILRNGYYSDFKKSLLIDTTYLDIIKEGVDGYCKTENSVPRNLRLPAPLFNNKNIEFYIPEDELSKRLREIRRVYEALLNTNEQSSRIKTSNSLISLFQVDVMHEYDDNVDKNDTFISVCNNRVTFGLLIDFAERTSPRNKARILFTIFLNIVHIQVDKFTDSIVKLVGLLNGFMSDKIFGNEKDLRVLTTFLREAIKAPNDKFGEIASSKFRLTVLALLAVYAHNFVSSAVSAGLEDSPANKESIGHIKARFSDLSNMIAKDPGSISTSCDDVAMGVLIRQLLHYIDYDSPLTKELWREAK